MTHTNRPRWPRAVVPLLLLATFAIALAAAGGLDPSFGTGGVVVADYGPYGGAPQDAAVQADGRLVVAGSDVTPLRWLVRRFSVDGTPDASFGSSGVVAPFGSLGGTVVDVAIDASGRILLAGDVSSPAVGTVVRLASDGTMDATFGSSGVATLSVGNARAVAEQPDGKIVVTGSVLVVTKKGSSTALCITRLNADGSLDASFGSGGRVVDDFTAQNDNALPSAVAIQSTGKIVVGCSSGSTFWALRRYTPSGAVDVAFGTQTLSSAILGGLAVDGSDRIVAAGVGGTPKIVRYLANGGLDSSFGTGGVTSLAATNSAIATGPSLGADGTISWAVVIAPGGSTTQRVVVPVRLLSNGSLDGSFGTGGYGDPVDVFPSWAATNDTHQPTGLALDSTGHLVVAGQAVGVSGPGPVSSTRHIAWFVARYLP